MAVKPATFMIGKQSINETGIVRLATRPYSFRGDSMKKFWQYVSLVVDWTVTITTIGLTVFLIVGTFALMLWNVRQ